jgi:hypothetical protein
MLRCRLLQARGLDALFYKSSAEPAALDSSDGGGAAADAAPAPPTGAGALPSLPLWRVQWATLPGTQVCLSPDRLSRLSTADCTMDHCVLPLVAIQEDFKRS